MSISDKPRDEGENRRYYDTFATIYEKHRHDGYHRWLDTRTIELLTPAVTGRDVLEVGCGTGLLLKDVATVARHATGLDLSHGMLRAAHERRLNVVQGSATQLPFADASFDVVYSFKVLAHVPDLAAAFAEMARVTRPGGRLFLELYNKQSLRYLVRRFRPAGAVGQGVDEKDVFTRFYDLAELRAMLPASVSLERTHGLRVATLAPQPFRWPVVGSLWARVEDALSASPLHRYAGFLVLELRKTAESWVGRPATPVVQLEVGDSGRR